MNYIQCNKWSFIHVTNVQITITFDKCTGYINSETNYSLMWWKGLNPTGNIVYDISTNKKRDDIYYSMSKPFAWHGAWSDLGGWPTVAGISMRHRTV